MSWIDQQITSLSSYATKAAMTAVSPPSPVRQIMYCAENGNLYEWVPGDTTAVSDPAVLAPSNALDSGRGRYIARSVAVGALSGDVTGTTGTTTVEKIGGVPVDTATNRTLNYALVWNGSGIGFASPATATLAGDVTGSQAATLVRRLGGHTLNVETNRATGKALGWTGTEIGFVEAGGGGGGGSSYLNVRDYGAVGDGVIDDTIAFALCAASNAEVFVPAGTYLLSSVAIQKPMRFETGAVIKLAHNAEVDLRKTLYLPRAKCFDVMSNTGTNLIIYKGVRSPGLRPEWFGAVGDGVADDTIPIKRAFEASCGQPMRSIDDAEFNSFAVIANAAAVVLSGIYSITSTISVQFAGISVVGEIGTLEVAGTNQRSTLQFDHSGTGIRLISHSDATQKPIAISFTNVNLLRGASHNGTGTGVSWMSDGGGCFLIGYRFEGCSIAGHDKGLAIEDAYSYYEVADVTISNCNIQMNNYGIWSGTGHRFVNAYLGPNYITGNSTAGVYCGFRGSNIAGPLLLQAQPNPFILGHSLASGSSVIGAIYLEANPGDACIDLTNCNDVTLGGVASGGSLTATSTVLAANCNNVTADVDFPVLTSNSSGMIVRTMQPGSCAFWFMSYASRLQNEGLAGEHTSMSVHRPSSQYKEVCDFGGLTLTATRVGVAADQRNKIEISTEAPVANGEIVQVGFLFRFFDWSSPQPIVYASIIDDTTGDVIAGQFIQYAKRADTDTVVWLMNGKNNLGRDISRIRVTIWPYTNYYGNDCVISPVVVWTYPSSMTSLPVDSPIAALRRLDTGSPCPPVNSYLLRLDSSADAYGTVGDAGWTSFKDLNTTGVYHALPVTGAAPVRTLAALAGYGAATFSGSSGYVSTTWAAGEMDSVAGDVTIFVVASLTGDGCLYDSGAAASTTHNGFTLDRASGTLKFTGKRSGGTDVASVANTATTPQLITAAHGAGSLTLRVGRAAAGSATCANPVAQSYLRIGQALDGTLPLTGKIYEIVVFNRAISSMDIYRVESYLSQKWGL